MSSMNVPPPPSPSQPSNAQVSILVFMKSLATPIVLYAEEPKALYEELKQIIKNANPASPKLIERPGVGPLKKVALIDTQIAGVAVQVDPALAAANMGPGGGFR